MEPVQVATMLDRNDYIEFLCGTNACLCFDARFGVRVRWVNLLGIDPCLLEEPCVSQQL
jgi:hypothetical protein